MKEFNSILLDDEEVQFLEEISLLTRELILGLPKPTDINLALNYFDNNSKIAFWFENNDIIGLNLRKLDLKDLTESIGDFNIFKAFNAILNFFSDVSLSFNLRSFLEELQV